MEHNNIANYIGGSRGGAASAPPPPTGSNSFSFAYIFCQKAYASEVGAPPPNGNSWIHHWPMLRFTYRYVTPSCRCILVTFIERFVFVCKTETMPYNNINLLKSVRYCTLRTGAFWRICGIFYFCILRSNKHNFSATTSNFRHFSYEF